MSISVSYFLILQNVLNELYYKSIKGVQNFVVKLIEQLCNTQKYSNTMYTYHVVN